MSAFTVIYFPSYAIPDQFSAKDTWGLHSYQAFFFPPLGIRKTNQKVVMLQLPLHLPS